MKKYCISLIYIIFIAINAFAAKDPNVVIEHESRVYKFVTDKSGALTGIECNTTVRFRANRTAATAVAIECYNDFLKVDKASGGVVTYGPHPGDDTFFSDSKVCIVKVDLKKAGATAEASFKTTFLRPEHLCQILISEAYDVELVTISFDMPTALTSRYKITPYNFPDALAVMSTQQKGDRTIETYTIKDLKSPELFADAPSLNVVGPKLLITGHFTDEQDLYRYLHKYLPTDDPGNGDVVAKAKEITAGCTTDRERVEAINDFVHSAVRYVAVENGDYGHRPDLPSEVLRKLYGDCKGAATLMVAMMRALGIDGRHVWVGTDNIPHDWTDVPNISSGNHMIACAMLDGEIVYLDGTARYNYVGLVPSGIQGQQVLIEDTPEHCRVERIPVSPVETNYSHLTVTLNAVNADRIDVNASMQYQGAFHAAIESTLADRAATRHDDFLKRLMTQAVGNCRVDRAKVEVGERSTLIKALGEANGVLKEADGETYLSLNPGHDLQDQKFKMDNRDVAGTFGFRSQRVIDVIFPMPGDMVVAELPKDVTVDNEWIEGSVTSVYDTENSIIKRTLTYTVKQPMVPAGNLATVNDAITRLSRGCRAQIILKKK